jgi:hypothetical protein
MIPPSNFTNGHPVLAGAAPHLARAWMLAAYRTSFFSPKFESGTNLNVSAATKDQLSATLKRSGPGNAAGARRHNRVEG